MSKLNCRVEDGYYPGMLEITGYDFRITVVTSATDLSFHDGIKRKEQAHLIAAAQDLYDALKDLLSRVSNDKDAHAWWCDEQEQAIKALAKARGEL